MQTLKGLGQKGPNMIVVVIPSDKGDTYAMVKKLLCCQMPIPSQCLTLRVLNKVKICSTKPSLHFTYLNLFFRNAAGQIAQRGHENHPANDCQIGRNALGCQDPHQKWTHGGRI